MRWREWRWLSSKEWRELGVSRAAALAFVAIGPLVGQAFNTAAQSYAEASGSTGGPAALAQGLSPLDGIIVPVFGAYALAATLLLPFVAIRLVSADKESGALRLLLQSPVSRVAMVGTKFVIALLAWALAWLPGLVALAWWRSLGGHLAAAEVLVVLAGHLLHGALVIALAFAAAAVTESAASAAVLTLAATLGTWALDFVGQVHGGTWQQLAAFTPDAALRLFEHGELRAALVLVPAVLVVALLLATAIWVDLGRPIRQRLAYTVGVVAGAVVLLAAAGQLGASWDLSEDRRNSFARADERALSGIRTPLHITAHLAPEDPRLADLQRGLFHKLARTLPDVQITVVSATGAGLFERPGEGYGEVWYELAGRRMMSRSTTEPIVLESLYALAQLTPPTAHDETAYSGYPLRRTPAGVPFAFYFCWPALVLCGAWYQRRRLGGASD